MGEIEAPTPSIGRPNVSSNEFPSPRRRVAAIFGLTLLEVLQQQDRPQEILQDEDVSVTMPRRLGLSEVVDRQIRSYREAVRKRRRMSDQEVIDLVRLVVRRPDAEDVFRTAGSLLAREGDGDPTPGRLGRLLPRRVAFALARRTTRRGLRALFGRRVGNFGAGPFSLEGRSLLFFLTDPGGDACHFVTGFCQTILDRTVGRDTRVVHARCEARKDAACRWTVAAEVRVRDREGVGELLMGPELETG